MRFSASDGNMPFLHTGSGRVKPASGRDRMNTVMTRHDDTDVLIAGGGFAGLTWRLRCGRRWASFSVTVADPALGASHADDERASAIVAAARRLFETLGVWDAVAGEAQPILDMVVTDSRLGDAVRPVFLTFAGEVEPGEPFAHMIENRHLVDALAAKAQARTASRCARRRWQWSARTALRGRVGVDRRHRYHCAAPGRRRRRALDDPQPRRHRHPRLELRSVGDRHNVAHERDHDGRAEEHFLPAGPFAILPLKGKRSSIVWTEDNAAKPSASWRCRTTRFHAELEQRFKLHLGEINVVGARRVHPLGFFVARSFIAERIALVGDAAHVIHPIAGQGLNMGLKDVAALAEVIVDAARLGLDPGAATVLERYQRWRRFDTMAMGIATDGLNRLFSNRSDVLRFARDIGLGLVDRVPNLKRLFIREAAGLVGDVPKLLRGEAL